MTPMEFSELRYGMFVHFGLFSLLERGEWVMNREQIPPQEMEKVAGKFNPIRFNADEICDLAVAGGMKYLVFTTMHHEGFRMFDTKLSDFNSVRYCGRDFVREVVDSARSRSLKIVLYHSLNNWHDQPDAVAALEDPAAYELFIERTIARYAELIERFKPIDVLWYDGSWPYHKEGWQAERMNAEMRKLQPDLMFNNRNGGSGDFATPEQELCCPDPWRPWEACMTLNDHWGFHRGDNNWKSPLGVIDLLLACGNGRGNLLLNVGPRGDGSIPEKSAEIIRTVGKWLEKEGGREAITKCDPVKFSMTFPEPGDRGDWDHNGTFTASGNNLFLTMKYFPGARYTLCGLRGKVLSVTACGTMPLRFTQQEEKVVVELPEALAGMTAPVLKFACDCKAAVYRTGGMRVPHVPHPRYDAPQWSEE